MTTLSSPVEVDELQAAISATMVELYNRHFPSHATMADTVIDKDIVLCLLEAMFDDREQELIDRGEASAVLERRGEIQQGLREEFSLAVERLTGRRVIAFMSANHVDPSLAAELFVLEPQMLARGHRDGASRPVISRSLT